mmetsp:Transcript_53557/g.135281  ORF Transcript_53557/g.135281 Transcript_53557/m.135281 type:complete len:213 (-) Transcript_53557:28-666(-)
MPAIKHPQRWVPRKWVMVPYAISKANMMTKRASSAEDTLADAPFWGMRGKMTSLMKYGQNFTAATMAIPMKITPTTGNTTTLITSKSPRKLKRTLKRINERMSSTKAAVMMACPKSCCRTPASPKSRSAIPTLVGASAVPTETPSGRSGLPYNTVRIVPVMSGKIVPSTATQHAFGPTILAFSKSKCMPLSKIIKATPAWPIKVNTSGVSPQ